MSQLISTGIAMANSCVCVDARESYGIGIGFDDLSIPQRLKARLCVEASALLGSRWTYRCQGCWLNLMHQCKTKNTCCK